MVSQNKHLDLSNHYHHASINQSQAYLCRFSKGYEGDQFHFPRNESIALLPCAYLHNMKARDAINDDFYAEHIKKAPVFISPYVLKHTMYRIEHGKIKPSKNLADALASMLDGNPEFLMIDEQKLVYETALDLAHKAQQGHKQTLIVKGGPGTGKSVVAINLLTELIKRELLTQYVSKNAAPREVFKKMLTGSRKKTHRENWNDKLNMEYK